MSRPDPRWHRGGDGRRGALIELRWVDSGDLADTLEDAPALSEVIDDTFTDTQCAISCCRTRVLATDWGKQLYLRRQGTVEPVFGQIKSNRGAGRFLRRGRSAVRSEWRLLKATHNLLKLHQHRPAPT